MVSDHGAVAELIAHGVAADLAEAAALALHAGIDIDLMGGAYTQGLPIALERGRVTMTQIDAAVRRVLALKARLGLMDDPYGRSKAAPASAAQVEARRQLARDAARRSIVLLTNRAGVLPLREGARIAVIGPLADARDDMLGPWAAAGRAQDMVTILEGLRQALPGSEIEHARGVGDRRRGAKRHPRRARSGPPRRGRGAVPGRSPRDERRGGQPRPPRSARTPA